MAVINGPASMSTLVDAGSLEFVVHTSGRHHGIAMHRGAVGGVIDTPVSVLRVPVQRSGPPRRCDQIGQTLPAERRTWSTPFQLGLRDRVQAVVFAYESGLAQPGAGQ